tara:strand:+ start:42130 stop:43926 length:1797 start_codon:yes stop_codon:yes gene_type:complete
MSNDQKNNLPINYTSREFSSIRADLMELAERFYPNDFQDFSEASFGSMMIDAVAYVADQMALQIDFNINESFLDTAFETKNIVRHGRTLGYKNPGRPSTYGVVALYVLVPANSTGMGPDKNYIPIVKRGTSFSSDAGASFVLTENVDFNNSKNQIVVARVNNSTGAPTHYAIKAYGNVVSGQFAQKEIKVGAYESFKRINLRIPNASEIISVFDKDGNQYFEVEYLSQDMIYKEIANKDFKNDNTPSILKPMLVSRKFTVETTIEGVVLQFGSGTEAESNVIANPQQVALDVFGKSYVTDTTFDPTKISKNSNFGTVPTNTTLIITYRATNPTNSNVAVNQLNKVSSVSMGFENESNLSQAQVASIRGSLEVQNETPITGDNSNISNSELKRRIYDTFPTQNRAVTQSDYESLAYRMPGKFGSIKRVSVQKDADSLKRNLNMYCISEDPQGKLIATNNTIKNNLKTWINQYRMLNDTIDILDAYVINLGIEFVVRPVNGANKAAVLQDAIKIVKQKFSNAFFIGEHVYVSDIYSELKKSQDILDVVKVKLTNKTGGQFSNIRLDINSNMSQDGTYLCCPANAIFEIKFPDNDIIGKIR